MAQAVNKFYRDLNQYRPQTKPMLFDIDDIIQSINNILMTGPNQRLFRRDFYSDLESLLFELINEITALRIQAAIKSSILKWETRVRPKKVKVTAFPEEWRYDVEVEFTIPSLPGQSFQFSGSLPQRSRRAVLVGDG